MLSAFCLIHHYESAMRGIRHAGKALGLACDGHVCGDVLAEIMVLRHRFMPLEIRSADDLKLPSVIEDCEGRGIGIYKPLYAPLQRLDHLVEAEAGCHGLSDIEKHQKLASLLLRILHALWCGDLGRNFRARFLFQAGLVQTSLLLIL